MKRAPIASRLQGPDRATGGRGKFALQNEGFRNPKSRGLMRICGLVVVAAGAMRESTEGGS